MRIEQIPLSEACPINNYEHITGMTLEELAKWMMDNCGCLGCAYLPCDCSGRWCIDVHIAWLKQEVDEECFGTSEEF